MMRPIFPNLGALESELRQHPQWFFADLDLSDYLVLEPLNDEAEKLLQAMEDHGLLPPTFSYSSTSGWKERLYRRLPEIKIGRLLVGEALVNFRTGPINHAVATASGRARDYAKTGDPDMLIKKPASFTRKALQLLENMSDLIYAMDSPNRE
jgi:hypothetical protein